jgi:hypothetical protein
MVKLTLRDASISQSIYLKAKQIIKWELTSGSSLISKNFDRVTKFNNRMKPASINRLISTNFDGIANVIDTMKLASSDTSISAGPHVLNN